MTFGEVIKENGIYPSLVKEAASPVDSYMFVSSDTMTTYLCATTLISLMSGLSPDEVETNKDVYILPSGDKVLKDDSDFITSSAYVMPSTLSKKYFVVRAAETANEAAQNKLLKTLEEPPETAVIILLCANEYAMLPTVKSRCRMLKPTTYPDLLLREVIKDEYPSCANPPFVTAMSCGSLSKLKSAAEGGVELYELMLEMLTCMKKSSSILPYAAKLTAKKERIGEAIEILELIFRDCMVVKSRPSLIKLKDNFLDINELSNEYTPEVVINEMAVLERAKRRLLAGGNANSIVDELLFSILEEKVKCQK